MDLSSHDGAEMPIPITSTYLGSHGLVHHHHQQQQHQQQESNQKKGGGVVVKYKECLKNHAASIGGNATDGCGEFMPTGEEGTIESFKCSACSCHRNFHRKEVEGEEHFAYDHHHYHQHHCKGGLIPGSESYRFIPRHHQMVMPLGSFHGSESEDMQHHHHQQQQQQQQHGVMVKKRFRTKFTAEQKEKMLEFAEKIGWRLQKEEESVVQEFCKEIGVKRRVLKVWMHNNKHNLAKKSTVDTAHSSFEEHC